MMQKAASEHQVKLNTVFETCHGMLYVLKYGTQINNSFLGGPCRGRCH